MPLLISKKGLDAILQEDYFSLSRTEEYKAWKASLRDHVATRAINARETRIAAGLFGDSKRISVKVSEIRVNVGPGYRLYFTIRDRKVVLLLIGGDKSSQQADIQKAIAMADREIEEVS